MKKLALLKLAIVILIFNTSTFAEEFKFGIEGGLDIINYRVTYNPWTYGSGLYYPMISFNRNGYVAFKSAGFWGISFEPGYIKKGKLEKNNFYDKNDDARFQMNYLQFPLLANFYLCDKFSISIGPELAYLINTKEKNKEYSIDVSHLYNKTELSGIVGINYSLHKHIDIGVKYNHGLTSITPKKIWIADSGDAVEEKNYTQYFQIFIRFIVSKEL